MFKANTDCYYYYYYFEIVKIKRQRFSNSVKQNTVILL